MEPDAFCPSPISGRENPPGLTWIAFLLVCPALPCSSWRSTSRVWPQGGALWVKRGYEGWCDELDRCPEKHQALC